MQVDFRPLLRKLSRQFREKRNLSTDPSRVLGAWLWQSLAFGSLAAAFGFYFSRLQTRILVSTRNQNYQRYTLFMENCQASSNFRGV